MIKTFMIWSIFISGYNCDAPHTLDLTQSFECTPDRCDDLIGPTNAYLQWLASSMQAQTCLSADAWDPWVMEYQIERPGHGKNGRVVVLRHPKSGYWLAVSTQVWAPRVQGTEVFEHELNQGASKQGPIDFAHDGFNPYCGNCSPSGF